ncbi:uncharacterized protein PGTG_10433 [Puccinia graminis f. sp. tritici CRL 75-36-700-3]|uniref:Uncharacterized protein n=1 Tax=Puccinia graminis f. sp. tritici (strain CRL 75-36-700-3 / race SCCL) TaxID=418459 RepID=E3KKY7_PUCGT|nr:uncharacterized protein PGTG_10433 [Puccinia graminis f. sp. tritici CRL 75-36-700-3]EFP84962.2 hypothetical protein PGTG_10433 [Puccinia graminis f. sp. tritici CRL 75-36-700-3]
MEIPLGLRESPATTPNFNPGRLGTYTLRKQSPVGECASGDPMPKSLVPYRKSQSPLLESSYSSSWESEVNQHVKPQYEEVYQNPAKFRSLKDAEFLKKLAKDAAKSVDSAVERSEKTIREDAVFRIVPDTDFLIKQFRKEWVAKLPPEKQEDPTLLKEIDQVQQKLKPILEASKSRFETERQIKLITKQWTTFQSDLDKALHNALHSYVEEETSNAVLSKLQNHFSNWNSRSINTQAKKIAKEFVNELGSVHVERIYAKMLDKKPRIIQINKKWQLKKYLVKQLTSAPHTSDEEFQFILAQLTKDARSWSSHKTDLQLLKKTPTGIARRITINPEKILEYKLRFQITQIAKQFFRDIEDLVPAELRLISERVTNNKEIMAAAYKSKVDELIHMENKDFQVQLFIKYFDVDKSAQEMYDVMNDLAREWNVDFEGFRRQFKDRLPRGEYNDLVDAASRSKSEYSRLLEYIKTQHGIALLEKLEEEHFGRNGQYASFKDSIKHFLVRLKENNLVNERQYRELDAKVTKSDKEPLTLLDSLQQELGFPIKLYKELQVESIPQSKPSLIHSSINEFLEKLRNVGLLTKEERNYFYHPDNLKNPSSRYPIRSFRNKVETLQDLPRLFEERLRSHTHELLPHIWKDETFKSQTLSYYQERVISKHKQDIENHLKKGEYALAFKELEPNSIKNAAVDYTSDAYWASKLWDDYFSRELPAMTSTLDTLKEMKNLRQIPDEKLAKPKELRDKVLEMFLGHVENPNSKNLGIPWVNDDTLKLPETEAEIEKLINQKNFILMVNPLQKDDPRLKDTPLRYLKKGMIDEWNHSVQYMFNNWNELYKLMSEKTKRANKMKRYLQGLENYHEVIQEIFDSINGQFSLIEKHKLYRFNMLPDDPRNLM